MENRFPNGVAIVIPSFEPDDRLEFTVSSLRELGAENIIVVNDGSSSDFDGCFEAVENLGATVLRHEKNSGKGAALRTGFKYCIGNVPDFSVAVTVDGDGHHKAEDVLKCAEISLGNGCAVLGVRDRGDKTIRGTAKYGNKILSFLINITCDFDMKISDPLTGLRAIPAEYVPSVIDTKGDSYDFELNMLLDFSTKRIPLRTFKRSGEYYDDGSRSHFRPVRDTADVIGKFIIYYGQQFKYLLSSLLCYSCEYILFSVLLGVLDFDSVTVANILCRTAAGTANFLINKNIVFGSKSKSSKAILKYITVAVCVMLLSTALIDFFNALFTGETNNLAKFIKMPIDICLFFGSYYAQKKWVFRDGGDENE